MTSFVLERAGTDLHLHEEAVASVPSPGNSSQGLRHPFPSPRREPSPAFHKQLSPEAKRSRKSWGEGLEGAGSAEQLSKYFPSTYYYLPSRWDRPPETESWSMSTYVEAGRGRTGLPSSSTAPAGCTRQKLFGQAFFTPAPT